MKDGLSPPPTGLLKLKTANETLRLARSKPVPNELFGPFWHEGELAILFGDTGTGKSVLAVQMAENIASGTIIDPAFESKAQPQSVLYLDFEMTDKQFELRYCDEVHEGDAATQNHFEFSDNFYRAEIDLSAEVPNGYLTFYEFLRAEIERLLEETAAKVLVVDNITFLCHTTESSREAIALMRELKTLKDKYGLSILALAHTRKRASRRPISLFDLHGSRALANFADSIFAVGESCFTHEARYFKHLKVRSREIQYDTSNVPGFVLAKRGRNFLHFAFVGYNTEFAHLKDFEQSIRARHDRAVRVRQLFQSGKSQRVIAAELGISAATVNRCLQAYAGEALEPDPSQNCPHIYFPEYIDEMEKGFEKNFGHLPVEEVLSAANEGSARSGPPAAPCAPSPPSPSARFDIDEPELDEPPEKGPDYDEKRYLRDVALDP